MDMSRANPRHLKQKGPPTEAAYNVKAAKTNAPIKVTKATTIRTKKNLAILNNAELDALFGLFRIRLRLSVQFCT